MCRCAGVQAWLEQYCLFVFLFLKILAHVMLCSCCCSCCTWRGVACGVAAYTERRPSDQAVDRSQRSRKIVSKRASVHAD